MDEHDKADEGFLTRWSRRKQGARREAPGAAEHGPAAGRARKSGKTADSDAGDEPVDLAKLPRIEDLTSETDITAFLKKGVPEELKRLALRKAWALDPAIRDFVEVAENQYDWNVPGGAPGYGDLAPGSDLGSLLAQATGQLPGPGAPEEIASSAPPPAAKPEPLPAPVASAQHTSGSDPIPPSVANTSPEAEDPGSRRAAVTVHGEVTEDPQPARPRRHGGALPT